MASSNMLRFFVAFTRWDPLRDLLALQEQMGRFSGPDAAGWTPPVDLYETGDGFVLTAELPGLDARAHRDPRQDGQSDAAGRRPARGRCACEHYHRVERGHGASSGAFALPTRSTSSGITADLKDGVLTVTIPKPRRARGAST